MIWRQLSLEPENAREGITTDFDYHIGRSEMEILPNTKFLLQDPFQAKQAHHIGRELIWRNPVKAILKSSFSSQLSPRDSNYTNLIGFGFRCLSCAFVDCSSYFYRVTDRVLRTGSTALLVFLSFLRKHCRTCKHCFPTDGVGHKRSSIH